MSLSWPLGFLAAASGLALGSFVVTAAIRAVRLEPVGVGRSHCDACGRTLSYAQTVPLVSYMGLRGVCSGCGARIDPTHLAGELAGGVVLVSAALGSDVWRMGVLALLGLVLVAAATIDAKIGRLPNALTGSVAALCAALAFQHGLSELAIGVVAALAAMFVLLLVRLSAQMRGKDPGLGLGDVKLFSALALWLGVATPWMVVVAAVLGLCAMPIFRGSDGRLAFGPMIAMAAWGVGMAGEWGGNLWPI